MLRRSLLAAVIVLGSILPAFAHDAGPSIACSRLGGTPADCNAAVKFYQPSNNPAITQKTATEENCANSFSFIISALNYGIKGSNNRLLSNIEKASNIFVVVCQRYPEYSNAAKKITPLIEKMYSDGGGTSVAESDLLVEPVLPTGVAVLFSAKYLAKCEAGTAIDCDIAIKAYNAAGNAAVDSGHMEIACANLVGKMKVLGTSAIRSARGDQSGVSGLSGMMVTLQAVKQVEQSCRAYPIDLEAASTYREKMKSVFSSTSGS